MYCPNCQNEVPESAKVCGYCGHRLSKPGMIFCTHCGEEIPTAAKVCGYCGTRQEQLAGASPAPLPIIKKKEETIHSTVPVIGAFSAPKAKLPGWVIPAVVVILLVVFAGVFIMTRPKTPSQAEAPAQAASVKSPQTAAPTQAASTKSPQPAAPKQEAAAQEPPGVFYVSYNCKDETVPVGSRLRLRYGWVASTAEHVEEYFDAAKHTVFVDGVSSSIFERGFDEITQSPDGYPLQKIWLDIGSLQPGSHEIKTIVDLTKKVTDGESWYGPGTDEPFFERICTVTVK